MILIWWSVGVGLVKDAKGPKAYEKIEIITERVILFEIVISHAKMIGNITRYVLIFEFFTWH